MSTVLKAVCVKDVKLGVFNPPMFVNHIGQAERWFLDVCAGRVTGLEVIAQHPEDFQLWLVGEFDDESAMLMSSAHLLLQVGRKLDS